MMEIEQAIKNDATGQYKNRIINQLHEASIDIRNEINRGVSPNEYERLSKFLQALTAGQETVEQIWLKR